VELERELRRIADAAVRHAADGEELTGIVPAEPGSGVRAYVCAFTDGGETTSWLVLDADGRPVEDRSLVRDAVSIAALYELAEEATGAAAEEPRVATPAELDALAAGADNPQAFVAAMKSATGTVDELVKDVERGYKVPLS
jgi:hypothetical protein